jgi:tetratricopeptide (TPR) repeat protein
LAEQEKYDEAIKFFDLAIKFGPLRPSVWNNRAQALRLMGKDEGENGDAWYFYIFLYSKF